MGIRLLILAIAVEALVQLWFKAAPLQDVRQALIRWTPFLRSRELDTHLFECKYCMSVWFGGAAAAAWFWMDRPAVFAAVLALAAARAANWLHLVFSYLADRQMDLRVARGRRG